MRKDIENPDIYSNNNSINTDVKSKDQIADVIGDFGKWQVQKIILVFLISVPGLAMIFSVPFVFYKTEYGCVESKSVLVGALNDSINSLKESQVLHQDNISKPLQKGVHRNGCGINCNQFEYDRSFWQQSVIMEWNLVCDQSYLAGKPF